MVSLVHMVPWEDHIWCHNVSDLVCPITIIGLTAMLYIHFYNAADWTLARFAHRDGLLWWVYTHECRKRAYNNLEHSSGQLDDTIFGPIISLVRRPQSHGLMALSCSFDREKNLFESSVWQLLCSSILLCFCGVHCGFIQKTMQTLFIAIALLPETASNSRKGRRLCCQLPQPTAVQVSWGTWLTVK